MNKFPKLAGQGIISKILRFNFRKNIISKQSKQNILGNAITVAETVPQSTKVKIHLQHVESQFYDF